MRSGEVDDAADRFGCHAIDDVVGDLLGRVVGGIFEDGPDRKARAFHQAGAGDLAWDPLNVLASRLVDVFHISLGGEVGSL